MLTVTPKPANLEQVRFVAADMDHTLLMEDSTLPKGLSERIDALASVGCEFCIASGRPMYTLQDLLKPYVDHITLISDNGASIARNGELIYTSDLPAERYHHMARVVRELGGVGNICGLDQAYIEDRGKPYDDFYGLFYTRRCYVPSLEDISPAANKFTVYFPNNDAIEQGDAYIEAIGGDFAFTYGGIMWLDIQAKGISKGSAMQHVSELMGIGLDEMAAFGDAPNDAEMLDTVAFSYAMANAVEGMEAHAKYVAPTNEERGVLQVIDQIVAARKEAGYGRA